MTRPNFEELDRLHGPNPGFFMARALREYPSISAYVRNLEERERRLTAALEQANECAETCLFRLTGQHHGTEGFSEMRANRAELLGEGRTG